MPQSLRVTLDFLRDLRENNQRAWFAENRARYEAARAAHHDFINDVIRCFAPVDDLGQLTAEQATYRINRDTRFAADKSPYKIAMGAVLGREGRKSTGRAYYIHLEPDNGSFVTSGLYMVMPPDLEKIRRAIADDPQPLRSILTSDAFKQYFSTMTGEQLKTAPKGYPKDHPALDLLRYKQFLALHRLTDEQVLSDGLTDYVIEVCGALKPFASYFHQVLAQ